MMQDIETRERFDIDPAALKELEQPALAGDLQMDYERALTALNLWRAAARLAAQEEARVFHRHLKYFRGEGPGPTRTHRQATDRLRRLAIKSFDGAMLAQDLFALKQRSRLAALHPKAR
jgi:hypothetical protein